jgi:hypothetical protein
LEGGCEGGSSHGDTAHPNQQQRRLQQTPAAPSSNSSSNNSSSRLAAPVQGTVTLEELGVVSPSAAADSARGDGSTYIDDIGSIQILGKYPKNIVPPWKEPPVTPGGVVTKVVVPVWLWLVVAGGVLLVAGGLLACWLLVLWRRKKRAEAEGEQGDTSQKGAAGVRGAAHMRAGHPRPSDALEHEGPGAPQLLFQQRSKRNLARLQSGGPRGSHLMADLGDTWTPPASPGRLTPRANQRAVGARGSPASASSPRPPWAEPDSLTLGPGEGGEDSWGADGLPGVQRASTSMAHGHAHQDEGLSPGGGEPEGGRQGRRHKGREARRTRQLEPVAVLPERWVGEEASGGENSEEGGGSGGRHHRHRHHRRHHGR